MPYLRQRCKRGRGLERLQRCGRLFLFQQDEGHYFMSENFQVGLPVVMGLALSIAWYFGYDAVALWIFIVTFAVLFAGHVHKVQGLARGIAVDTGERMAESVAALMSETPGQDRATSISATMGEVACWPFRMIIGVVISNVLERVLFRRTPLANLTERAACLWFVIPLVLLVLLSMALQCWFLLTQFPTETRILWAFQATVGITTAGYVGFLAHFSMRRDFLRNFTSSAVPPGLYFVLALILVFVTAILIRLTFDVTFYGGSDTLSADNAFDTARAIVLNPGIFDIPDALKEAQSLADMRSRFGAYVSDMTLQRALDIFLGFSILTTFGRSAMSALVARRSDEDRMKRAMAFLRMGWWDRIEAEANEMQDRKFWGALMCFVALHKRDINQFEAAALEADLPSSVNSLGPEPAVQLYYGVLDYAWSVPIDVTEMLALADFAGEHGLGRAAQMQLLNVYSIIRPFPHAAFDALIETSVTAKASFEMR